ncbi:MAG: phytase [Planctomycetota bacterium]
MKACSPALRGPARRATRAPLPTLGLLCLAACTIHWPEDGSAAAVLPDVETDPVPSAGDAADDIAIWVHPADPGLSTVIGTDKQAGLAVYDLAGHELEFRADGSMNSVDLRYRFPLGGGEVALATAGERSANRLAVYAVDPSARTLQDVAARPITLGIEIYGSCMYRSPATGDTYFFGSAKSGGVEQWRLFDDGSGAVDAELVRSFDVGSQTEGCVADDENAFLFIGEESVGIWRYGAEPDAGENRVSVDTTGAGGHLTADVEGLAIYYGARGGGYLLASSQGNSTFAVYERAAPHAFLLSFWIAADSDLGIDEVTGTDGIEVMNLALGAGFPQGVFVAQDDSNSGANQNFKLVPWEEIAQAADPPLVVDSTYDAGGALRPGSEALPPDVWILLAILAAHRAAASLYGLPWRADPR